MSDRIPSSIGRLETFILRQEQHARDLRLMSDLKFPKNDRFIHSTYSRFCGPAVRGAPYYCGAILRAGYGLH
jgi:hypothetical protein